MIMMLDDRHVECVYVKRHTARTLVHEDQIYIWSDGRISQDEVAQGPYGFTYGPPDIVGLNWLERESEGCRSREAQLNTKAVRRDTFFGANIKVVFVDTLYWCPWCGVQHTGIGENNARQWKVLGPFFGDIQEKHDAARRITTDHRAEAFRLCDACRANKKAPLQFGTARPGDPSYSKPKRIGLLQRKPYGMSDEDYKRLMETKQLCYGIKPTQTKTEKLSAAKKAAMRKLKKRKRKRNPLKAHEQKFFAMLIGAKRLASI